ncbi:MAG TPA: O-antigen ligase family protein [Candidatus Polarisedimenticolia bacterium]|nr:O-antigen ligase family protein [Candidatus Polarisedimenticolia bacterium]
MSLLFLLAAALLATSTLLPPEIHPAGRLVAHGLAALLVLALGFAPRSAAGAGSWRRAAWLVAPLACASLLLVDGGRARGLDEAAAITCFAVAFFAGRRIGTGMNQVASLGVVAALLGVVISAQAIAQHHWAYPETAAALRAAQDPAADPFLVRLEAGRPSGPFSLPAALAGFLALSLPMTLFAARTARPGLGRVAWSSAIVLQLDALLLTRSLGGLLAATVACAFALAPAEGPSGRDDGSARGRLTRVAIAAGLVFAAGAALFVYARRAEIGSHAGADPLSLRLGNWRAAVEMVRDHPILGVGPGRFPVFYPRFIAAGMNETQFAHNSYLQLAATWGAWTLAPLAFLVAAFYRPKERRRGAVAAAAGAATGFLLHNAIDFTFFLPGVALPAALLLGVGSASGAARPAGASAKEESDGRPWPARRRSGVVVAALLLVYVATADRSAWHLERARALAQVGPSFDAEAEARKAAAACPWDPDPRAFLAQSLLARHATTPEEETLRRVTAERAARLEPESAILHHTVALDRAAAADPAAAWIEEERAHRLYPGKPLYRPEAEAKPDPDTKPGPVTKPETER